MNAKTITTFATLMFSLIAVPVKANDINQQKAYYQSAKQEIEAMLEGRAPLSYERAIYLIENAWYGSKLTYKEFQSVITYNTDIIRAIANQNRREQPQGTTDFFWDALKEHYRKDKGYYEKALINWAVFKYMTDTTYIIQSSYVAKRIPLQYSKNDPFGTTDWNNTLISNLLVSGKGNCFALTSLYKIFSERLNSEAYICTAPGHIYICHRNEKGTMYNVELASRSFPGTGTLSTLTYTTLEAIRNGISLRQLDLNQSVALSLVYLAKGYQHKFNVQGDDDFLLECAELALKYDTLNLNALLLKAEVLETKLVRQQNDLKELQKKQAFVEYQEIITQLYNLGYREMPLEMKNFLIKGWSQDSSATLIVKEHRPNTYNQLGVKYNRFASLSWGLFDEEIKDRPIEQYNRTFFDTKNQKIIKFEKRQVLYNNYSFDPVVFAWSIDPLAHEYPGISPYAAFANNPIIFKDKNGNYVEGIDGKPVTYKMLTNGKIQWSANATSDTKRIGSAMLKTETGREMFSKLQGTSYPIGVKLNNPGDGDFGKTIPTWTKDADGNNVLSRVDMYVNEKSMKMWERGMDKTAEGISDIEGTLRDLISNTPDGEEKQALQDYLLMKTGKHDDVIGATGSHEAGHASDPENLKMKPSDPEREVVPNQIEQKELDERTK